MEGTDAGKRRPPIGCGQMGGARLGPTGLRRWDRAAGSRYSENSSVFYLIPSTRYYLHKRKGSA